MELEEIKALWNISDHNQQSRSNKTDELIRKLISQNVHRRLRNLWLYEAIGVFVLSFMLVLVFTLLPKLPMTGLYISSYLVLVVLMCYVIIWQIIRFRTVTQLHKNMVNLSERCKQLQRFVKLLSFENKTMLPVMLVMTFTFGVVFFKTIKQQDFFVALHYSWTLRLNIIGALVLCLFIGRIINNYLKSILHRVEEELKDVD